MLTKTDTYQAAAGFVRYVLALAAIAAAIWLMPDLPPAPSVPGAAPGVTRQYIVTTRADYCEALEGVVSVMEDFGDGMTRCVVVSPDVTTIQEASGVVAIEPDTTLSIPPDRIDRSWRVKQADASPKDDGPCVTAQWHHGRIESAGAWEGGSTGASVTVAVVDTGVGPSPGLAIVGGRDFTGSGSWADGHGHGTHVAGISSQIPDPGRCMAGVAYESSVLAVRVLNSAGSGSTSAIASGIVWASQQTGVRVINLSLGGPSGSSTLQAALASAVARGVLPVCAAGNAGTQTRLYPAGYAECLSVSATDSADGRASFSTYGSWVNTAAPGVGILSLAPGTTLRTATMSGTSMASPVVAGLAALLFSRGASLSAVRSAILDTSVTVGSWQPGRRINARLAAGRIVPPAPTATPTLAATLTPTVEPTPTTAPTPLSRACFSVDCSGVARAIPCPPELAGRGRVNPGALPDAGKGRP